MYEEVDMVFISTYLDEFDVVGRSKRKTQILECVCYFWCEYVTTILNRKDEVIYEKCFAVTTLYVFNHYHS